MTRSSSRARWILAGILLLAVWAGAGVRRVDPDGAYAIREGLLSFQGPRRVEGGLHVVLPGLQRLVRYPAGESSADFTQDGVPWVSKEGSKLAFRARVRYRLAPERLLDAHRAAAGKPVEASIVRPALAEALEATSRDVASPGVGTEAFRAGVRVALAAALDPRRPRRPGSRSP